MHIHKQYIVRNTIIILTSFVGGIITTVVASISSTTTLTPDQYASNMLVQLATSITGATVAEKLSIYQSKLADIPYYIATLTSFKGKLESTIGDIHLITDDADINISNTTVYKDYVVTPLTSRMPVDPVGSVVTTNNSSTVTVGNNQTTNNVVTNTNTQVNAGTTGTTESNSNMSQQNQTTTNPTGTVNNTNQIEVVSTFPVTTDPRDLIFTVTPNKTKIIAGDTVEIAYNIGAAFTTCTAQFQVGNSWTTQNTGEFFTSGRDERQGVFVVNRPYSKMIVDCIGTGGITKRSQEMPLELVNIPTNLNSNEMKNFLNGFNFTTAKNTKPYCISVNANTCPVILKSKGLPYRINSSVNSVNGAFDLVQCVYKDVGGTWNVDGLGGARGINSGYIAGFSVADAEFCYNDANFKSAPFYDHGDTPAITQPLPPSDPSSQVSVVAAPIPTVKGKSSGSQDFITLGSTDTELRTRDGETATMQFGNDGGAATCTLNGGTVPNSIAYSDNYTYSCTNTTATKSVNFHVTVLAPRVVDYEAVTPYVTEVLSRLGQTDMAYQEIANRYKVISLGMTDQQKYEIIKRITYALGGGEAQIAGVKAYIDSH